MSQSGGWRSETEHGAKASVPVQDGSASEPAPTAVQFRLPVGYQSYCGLQLKADAGSTESSAEIHDAAQRGTSGLGEALPHLDAIQRSFGRHDVTAVRAYSGAAAAGAAREMGAEAFAVGSKVAFGGSPSLHTAERKKGKK
jgi:hypothetical protein